MTKIFWGNQYVTKFRCTGEKLTKLQKIKCWIVKWILRLFFTSCLILAVIGGILLVQPQKIQIVTQEVIKEVETKAPVLERIARCESENKHFAPSGQVLVRTNTNGSYDVGRYQINSIWNKTATSLGYQLFIESDNEAFAKYLYKNFGTEPWKYSKHCWNK